MLRKAAALVGSSVGACGLLSLNNWSLPQAHCDAAETHNDARITPSSKIAPILSIADIDAAERKLNAELDAILERARVVSGTPGLSAAVYYNPYSSHARDDTTQETLASSCVLTENQHKNLAYLEPDMLVAANGSHALSLLSAPFKHSGDIIYTSATGLASLELGVPMRPEHRMCLASISKPFTTIMLARLAQLGLVDMDEDLHTLLVDSGYWKTETYTHNKLAAAYTRALGVVPAKHGSNKTLPTATPPAGAAAYPPPAYLSRLTLAQALQHTAGFRHYASDEATSTVAHPTVFSSILPFIYDHPYHRVAQPATEAEGTGVAERNFVAGESFTYTTHGYAVAGAALEAAVFRHLSKVFKNQTATQDNFRNLSPEFFQTPPHFPNLVSMLLAKPLQLPFLGVLTQTPTHMVASEYQRLSTAPTRLVPAPPADRSNRWAGGGLYGDAASVAMVGGALTSASGNSGGGAWLSDKMLQRIGRPLILRKDAPQRDLNAPASAAMPAPSTGGDVAAENASGSYVDAQNAYTVIPYGLGFVNLRDASPFVRHPVAHMGYDHTLQQQAQLLDGPLLGHSGEGVGSSGYLLVAPREGIAVALLANQGGCGGVLEMAAVEMAVKLKQAM